MVLRSDVAGEEFPPTPIPQGAGMIWSAEHLEGGTPGVSLDLSVLPSGTTPLFLPSQL